MRDSKSVPELLFGGGRWWLVERVSFAWRAELLRLQCADNVGVRIVVSMLDALCLGSLILAARTSWLLELRQNTSVRHRRDDDVEDGWIRSRWCTDKRNESLRVLPPVPQTMRITDKTDYIEGVLVPKGTVLNIPVSNARLST